jgi:hypothetical protein
MRSFGIKEKALRRQLQMKGLFQGKSPSKANARALRRPFEGKDSSKEKAKDLLRHRRVERNVPPKERPFEDKGQIFPMTRAKCLGRQMPLEGKGIRWQS